MYFDEEDDNEEPGNRGGGLSFSDDCGDCWVFSASSSWGPRGMMV